MTTREKRRMCTHICKIDKYKKPLLNSEALKMDTSSIIDWTRGH